MKKVGVYSDLRYCNYYRNEGNQESLQKDDR